MTLAIKTGTAPADDISEGLPEGWALTTLRDACEINPPKAPKDSLPADAPVTFVPMPAVDAEEGAITKPQARRFSEVRKGFTSFRDGDVIMAKITPCMENGKVAIARSLMNGLGFGSTEFHVFRSTGATLPEFVYHYVRQESYRRSAEAEMTGSVGQKRVPQAFLETTELPLPPMPEQVRIVKSLTELLKKVKASHHKLTRVPAILKRFRQAVLAAACSGRLTEGCRSSSALVWRECVLGDILREPLRNGHSAKASLGGGGVRTLTLSAVTYGDFSEHNTKLTVADPRKVSDLWLRPGDILVERSNALELVGTARLYRGKLNFAIFPDLVIRVRVNNDADPEFVEMALQTDSAREYFKSSAQGTQGSMPKIDQTTISIFPLRLPPLEEQKEIVRRVDGLLTFASEVQQRINSAELRVEKLTQSILAKAFRGELVPTEAELARREGREYEPASVLLERIKAERTSLDSGKALRSKQPAPRGGKQHTVSA